jgi:hypothetical protein
MLLHENLKGMFLLLKQKDANKDSNNNYDGNINKRTRNGKMLIDVVF